jgi:membrane-associated phospholipid phosphatase
VLVWIAAIAGAGVGLVGMNLHFVSDVIAGGYVGSGSAAAVLWIVERWRLNREKRYEHQRQFQ